MGRKDFKKLAKNLICEYGTTDPFKIAKYEGIQIVYLDFRAWLGLYTNINNVKTIFINSNIPKFSQKIVCGHELGHSQQIFKEAVFMKESYLFGVNKIETEANEFNAELIFNENINYEDLTEFDIILLDELKKYL